MTQGNQPSNLLIKVLGSAALAGLVAIVALVWSIYSSRSEELATERQLANQATQIAKQDVQITLNAEQNRLLSEQATVVARQASIDEQLRTPLPTNNADFAPTATALAIQSIQIEATRQAIEDKQKQIEATQTSVAQPLPAPTPMPSDSISPPSVAESDPEPLREHYQVVVGEGIFAKGTFSDGMAPHSEQWLWDNDHFDIQRIRLEEQPDGCDVARYNTNFLWISGSPGMSLSINEDNVGEYKIKEDAHGYIFEWPIHMGDRICAVGFSSSIGFQIVIGPDIYFHYDSYCYRGSCR